MSRRRKNLFLVLACTLLGAGAQVFFKLAGMALGPTPTPMQMVTCLPLIVGYVLYGVSTILLSFALRNDELSSMYPIISLTYVWVMFLSIWFFAEVLNPFKVLGVAVIMAGVAVLGRPDKNKATLASPVPPNALRTEGN